MNSNITLKSNIYINKTGSRCDPAFLKHITDYRVLKRYSGNSSYWETATDWMMPTQKAILAQGQPNCSLEQGTMSWGVPVGSDRFVCRCEQRDCRYFLNMCSKYSNFEQVCRGQQEMQPTRPAEVLEELPLYHSTDLPVVSEELQPIFPVDVENTIEVPTPPITIETPVPPPAQTVESIEKTEVTPNQTKDRSIDIDHAAIQTIEQETIIHADASQRIWVNAGPGTGKTYTVIQRIKTLLSEDLDNAILVLCFSKNAVQVIRDRLMDALGYQADALISEGRLVIRTFDSFATYMLEDELNPAWDYNRRIEEFIQMMVRNPGALNDMLSYLIVDEIQDTVGVRARMLLSMLDELTCGVLLLGDRCQAIFDWTIKNTQDMSFTQLTRELEKTNFIRYELEGNHRQAKELANKAMELRMALLEDDEAMQEQAVSDFKTWAKTKWHSYDVKALPQCLSGATDLILCKTNGEAAHVSQILFEDATHITHVMKQSANHKTLACWIAKALFGNDGGIMEKSQFIANANDYEIDSPEEKWRVLKSLDGHEHAPGLHIQEVLTALSRLDGLPDVCLNLSNRDVIVSTIHRAKGSEAEHVFWLDSPLMFENQQDDSLSDALKAAYVAATRAKTDIHIIHPDEKFFMKSVGENRWIQAGYGKNKKPFCKGIALLPEDVDHTSFVDQQYAEAAQSVLACIEPSLCVDLYPNAVENRFEIYFDGQMIGRTSSDFTKALFAGFEATNHNRNWPSCIRDVHIAAVTTVIASSSNEIDDSYRTAGCWLGIELGGFPNIAWY